MTDKNKNPYGINAVVIMTYFKGDDVDQDFLNKTAQLNRILSYMILPIMYVWVFFMRPREEHKVKMQEDCVLFTIMALTGFMLFVGVPSDGHMYFGYFWKLCAFLANTFNL